jgi:hypothetical protein
VWFALALAALAVVRLNRADGFRLVWWGAVLAGALIMLAYLRDHTLVVAAWATAVAVWAGRPDDRVKRGLLVLALAVLVPWATGAGPGGLDVVRTAGSLEERRLANAENADTAFARPADAEPATTDSATTDSAESSGLADDLAGLPRGLSVMLFEPYPWQHTQSEQQGVAKLENLVWYPLLALAAVGVTTAVRRRGTMAGMLLFPVLAAAGITLLYALTEGNFGTAFRHRGEIVGAVALMAAVGAWRLSVGRGRQIGVT